jgi:HEPN domain
VKGKIDDFINRSFRDIADNDYVAARICWRNGLDHQFLWMAQQAVEKYLKAILLYHRRPTKALKHDISTAYSKAKEIPEIDLKCGSQVEQFIEHLTIHGPNRYFEWNLRINGNELLLLDKCIWHLRVRCVPVDSYAARDGIKFWTSDQHFELLRQCKTPRARQRIQIPFGKLEAILASKSEAREALVWKNFYFGRNNKRTIKWKSGFRFASPMHVCDPSIFAELDKLVQFSPQVRNHFTSPSAALNPTLAPTTVRW